LRKSGGDRKYVTADAGNGKLSARASRVGRWEKFRVENHPAGGITLKALSNNKFVQVQNRDANAYARALGNSKGGWERFTWKNKGSGKVAIKSVHSGKWLQAPWNRANTVIYPKGNADQGWETFDWSRESGSKDLNLNASKNNTVSTYPNPVNENTVLNMSFNLGEQADVSASLYGLTGQKVLSLDLGTFEAGSHDLELFTRPSSIENGIYILKIKTESITTMNRLIFE